MFHFTKALKLLIGSIFVNFYSLPEAQPYNQIELLSDTTLE